jgi:hypothetical protein
MTESRHRWDRTPAEILAIFKTSGADCKRLYAKATIQQWGALQSDLREYLDRILVYSVVPLDPDIPRAISALLDHGPKDRYRILAYRLHFAASCGALSHCIEVLSHIPLRKHRARIAAALWACYDELIPSLRNHGKRFGCAKTLMAKERRHRKRLQAWLDSLAP